MKKVLLGVVIGVFGWQAWSEYPSQSAPVRFVGETTTDSGPAPPAESVDADEFTEEDANDEGDPKFSCDGRTMCSQMTSCAEALYFLRNCPDVEMDGNGDGEPCESQWCGNSR